jgi:UDP-N-acetylmuramate-alanine ligase
MQPHKRLKVFMTTATDPQQSVDTLLLLDVTNAGRTKEGNPRLGNVISVMKAVGYCLVLQKLSSAQ